MVPHTSGRFCGQEITSGGFEELQNGLVFPRRRVRNVNGMKLRQLRMITLSVHRRVNDGRRHRVEPDVIRRVFQCQRLTRRWHRRFRQHRQQFGRGAARLIHRSSRDAYHMPRILLLHLRNHLLRHVEEAGDVGIHH